MIQLFHAVSSRSSKLVTETYSTSFSAAVRLLHKSMRLHIHHLYGFVRFADEIVDTFHGYDKAAMLREFKEETFKAIDRKISVNPVLHSLQITVNRYHIDLQLIHSFFDSMELDLNPREYDRQGYEHYIYGSAEVVGLMCLYVFCEGDQRLYTRLAPYARRLGAAFQKVNFLRDIKSDFENLNRVYFPGCNLRIFTPEDKAVIEQEIQDDFDQAYKGILQLPVKAKFGVYVAYKYYLSLFRKIRKMEPEHIKIHRVRIPNYSKALIIAKAGLRHQLNIL